MDDLWRRPQQWQTLGQKGQDYVRSQFGGRSAFTQSLDNALRDLATPLGQRMRRQGLLRAAGLEREKWRAQFGQLIEGVLDSPARPYREEVVVRPRTPARTVSVVQNTVLVPVRVANQG